MGEKTGGGKSSGSKFSPSLEQVIQGVNRDSAWRTQGREKSVPREQTIPKLSLTRQRSLLPPAATSTGLLGRLRNGQSSRIEQEPGVGKGWTAAKARGG